MLIGLYRFNWQPFRINIAAGIFLQITLLNDVDFSIAYFDDILTKSESREQRAERVKDVFEKNKAICLETYFG